MEASWASLSYDVIHVTDELAAGKTGGVGTVVDNLASGLSSLGLRTLTFLVDGDAALGEVRETRAGASAVAKGRIEELRRYPAPVLHIHCYEPHEPLLDVTRTRKTVYTIHSLLKREAQSNDVALPFGIRWQERLIAAVDRVVVISEAEREAYVGLGYRDLNPHVSVVHNGLRAPGAFRAPRGVETIGFCGRLVPRKRPEYPQMILNQPRFRGCRTLVAGRGFSAYARDLLASEDLEERVDYLGWCADARLEAFFDRIDVLAMPSTYEPFGLAALEAMGRGIPVVCPASGGLAEVLGEHAYRYRGTSFEAFAAAMTRWIGSSPSEREMMSRAAFRRYEARFTDRHMAQGYAAIYGELAAPDRITESPGRGSGTRNR